MLFNVCLMIVRDRFIDLASLFMLSLAPDVEIFFQNAEARENFQHLEGLIELIELIEQLEGLIKLIHSFILLCF